MSYTERIAAAREQQDPQLLIDALPYARALGMHARIEAGDLVIQMDFQQRLIGDLGIGALHSGTIGGLLETTAMLTLVWSIERIQLPRTLNLSLESLRSGRPKATSARATVIRHGRGVANVRALAWQEDPGHPIAAAHAHFLLATSP